MKIRSRPEKSVAKPLKNPPVDSGFFYCPYIPIYANKPPFSNPLEPFVIETWMKLGSK